MFLKKKNVHREMAKSVKNVYYVPYIQPYLLI